MASAISHFQSSPHYSIVRVTGELDLITAPLLRAALKCADADPVHEFVVELSAVTFMDCSGLAPLLEAHATLGGRLRLCDLPRAVSWLLHLTGLDATFAPLTVPRARPPKTTPDCGVTRFAPSPRGLQRMKTPWYTLTSSTPGSAFSRCGPLVSVK